MQTGKQPMGNSVKIKKVKYMCEITFLLNILYRVCAVMNQGKHQVSKFKGLAIKMLQIHLCHRLISRIDIMYVLLKISKQKLPFMVLPIL